MKITKRFKIQRHRILLILTLFSDTSHGSTTFCYGRNRYISIVGVYI